MVRWYSDRHRIPLLARIGMGVAVVLLTAVLGALPALAATTITFLTPPWGVPPDKEALSQFESANGIKVEIISLPMAEVYSRVQVASASKRAAADVILLSEEAPSFIVAPGYMEPLQQRIRASNTLNADDIQRMDFWTINGNVYGVTTYLQLVMLDYNAERLQKAGFSKPPATWPEFVEMARAVKAKGIDEYPISFAAVSWSWYVMALSSGEPMFNEALEPTFNGRDATGRKMFHLLIDMFNKDKVITREMLTKVTPHDVFMGGVGTLHQSFQGAHAIMNNPEVSKQAPNVRYVLMPEQHWTWSLDAAIGMSRFSTKKDAAWKFIEWYVSPKTQMAIFKAYGLFPSRKSVQADLQKQGQVQQFDLQQQQSRYVRQLPRYVPWWGPWDASVTEKVRQAVLGQTTPDRAIDDLAREWNDLKMQYGF